MWSVGVLIGFIVWLWLIGLTLVLEPASVNLWPLLRSAIAIRSSGETLLMRSVGQGPYPQPPDRDPSRSGYRSFLWHTPSEPSVAWLSTWLGALQMAGRVGRD